MRIILTALAVPGFALGLATAAGELIKGEAPAYSQPTSIVWADRVYSNNHDFAVWLRSRGVHYRTWAARHPAAAGILEGRSASDRMKRTAGVASPTASRHTGLALMLVFASLLGLLALVATLRAGMPRLALARHRRARPPPERSNRRPRMGKLVGQRGSASQARQNSVAVTRQRLGGVERRVAWSDRHAALTQLAHSSLSASRGALTGFQRRFTPPESRATLTRLLRVSLSASHDAVTSLRQRVRPPSGAVDDASEQAWLLAQTLRRQVPNVAFYVMSVLLGLVVGVSIVIYAN